MAEKLNIYKCMICGNVVEVLHAGDGELVCCGEAMKKLVAQKEDAGKEKHVPVIEKTDCGVKVNVGSVPHPMEEKHYIEWVAVYSDGSVYREFLKPGDEPKAVFCIESDNLTAREHCTLHGLWGS